MISHVDEGRPAGAQEGIFGFEVSHSGHGLDESSSDRLLHEAEHGQTGDGQWVLGRRQFVGQLEIPV